MDEEASALFTPQSTTKGGKQISGKLTELKKAEAAKSSFRVAVTKKKVDEEPAALTPLSKKKLEDELTASAVKKKTDELMALSLSKNKVEKELKSPNPATKKNEGDGPTFQAMSSKKMGEEQISPAIVAKKKIDEFTASTPSTSTDEHQVYKPSATKVDEKTGKLPVTPEATSSKETQVQQPVVTPKTSRAVFPRQAVSGKPITTHQLGSQPLPGVPVSSQVSASTNSSKAVKTAPLTGKPPLTSQNSIKENVNPPASPLSPKPSRLHLPIHGGITSTKQSLLTAAGEAKPILAKHATVDGSTSSDHSGDAAAKPTTPSAPKALRKAYATKGGGVMTQTIGEESTIEKKLSMRRKKEAGEASKSGVDLVGDKSEADDREAKRTANAVVAAFSTQNVQGLLAEHSEEVKKEKIKEKEPLDDKKEKDEPRETKAANLRAQLQLPPSVASKVNKIIASCDKSRRSHAAKLTVLKNYFFFLCSTSMSHNFVSIHKLYLS